MSCACGWGGVLRDQDGNPSCGRCGRKLSGAQLPPMQETPAERVARVYKAHYAADGKQGHTHLSQWRRCMHPDCRALRDELAPPPKDRPVRRLPVRR